ncbi:MAG: TraR/DksA C4-type zinc finger protein [Bryobacteraceae bacterium]|jgi:DnaK suppressor protein
MTPEVDRLQIKRQLEDAHHEIVKSCALREEVCIEPAADSMDQMQAAEARELAIRNLDRSARRLRNIENALRRLEAGEYGTCANCDEEIGPKRLRAVPWTQLCLKCQEIADQSEFGDRRYDAAELFLHAA